MRLIQALALAFVMSAAVMPALRSETDDRRPSSPAPTAGQVMTTAGSSGGILLVGERLWKLSAEGWMPLTASGPANRTMAAAAFDTRRGVLVVFGGVSLSNGSRYGETWEWNGGDWVHRDVRTPGIRDHHAMAYDEARGQVVMYGGWDVDRKFSADTWTWDGTVWTRANTTSGPGGAGHLAMAYDSRRQRVVMFGGDVPDRAASSDTWEWDGREWHRVAAGGPDPRTRHALAYDPARGVTVMFGGQVGSGRTAVFPQDTWEWDGTRWTRIDAPGPVPRYTPSIAYDHQRKRLVLFGGNRGGPPFDRLTDTWEFDGASWKQVHP